MEMDRIRENIDRIDDELVKLCVARMDAVGEIAARKQASARPIRDHARERAIINRVTAAAGETYINDGTVTGTYRLYAMMGMTLLEFAEMTGMQPQDAAKFKQALANPQKLNQMLGSKQAKALYEKLTKGS